MYPNQGYPGQYSSAPFGSGMPQMPQPGMPQMPQPGMPFGSGYPTMPQPGFGQPTQMPAYGQPPQMPGFGQPPQMPAYGQPPQIPSYGQPPQMPAYGQPPQIPSYGQPPQMPAYGQPSQAPNFGQSPPMSGYGQPQMPVNQGQSPSMSAYPPQQQPQDPSSVYPQMSNYPAAQATQSPQHGSYNSHGVPLQQEHVHAQQYNASYSSPTTMTTAIRRGRPTVTPFPNFDASNDAAVLRKAMKGIGTDEDALINVLCRRPSYQRVEIVRCYKTAYGKDLIEDIRSETSGNFENVLVALLIPSYEFYCRELFEAMSGAGTDEDALIEVMCTMSNQEIRAIGQTYVRMYGRKLEDHLRSDTSGCMKRLMTSLSVGGRDESMRTDINAARTDAESLKRAGIGRFGTDESEFNRILCLRNYEQIKLICQEYEKLTGNSLEKDIKREFSGDIEDALLAIIRVANNRPEFFARRLHKSMAGLGTADRSLIRLCVSRSEIDMADIKDEFQRYYGKSLKSFIKGDTSGHYKHALYALCGENRT